MIDIDPPPIERASPSLLEKLRTCPLQVALRHGSRGPRPSTPAARLGIACHAVLEAVAKQELDSDEEGFEDAFEQAWSEAIHAQEAEASSFASERRWGRATSWHGVNERKVRLRRLARRLHDEIARWHDHDIRVETFLEPPGTFIAGKPDLVVRSPVPHRVVDFKSGAIADPANGGLKDAYRRQVLLYAHLETLDSGHMPELGIVIPLQGPDREVVVTHDAMNSEVDQASELIEHYNRHRTDPDALASPGAAACSWCPYKLRCDPFWSWLDTASDDWGDLVAIEGTVTAVQPVAGGMASIVLSDIRGTASGALASIERIPAGIFPELDHFTEGVQVRVAGGLVRSTDPLRISASSQTQLAVLDGEARR